MLEVPAAVNALMIAHALGGLPNEACGLFAGVFGSARVERFYPMRNAAASGRIYRLEAIEMLEVERAVDEAGLAVMGVMHSHTHTTNYPSPTDVDDAARFDPFGMWHFIIISLRHPEPSTRSFRILNRQITEEPPPSLKNPYPSLVQRLLWGCRRRAVRLWLVVVTVAGWHARRSLVTFRREPRESQPTDASDATMKCSTQSRWASCYKAAR